MEALPTTPDTSPSPGTAETTWRWHCDGCGLPVELPGAGRWSCPSCWHPVHVKPQPGVLPLVRGASPVVDATRQPMEAPCAKHGGSPAVGVCERCGDLRCDACTRVIQGRFYCPDCVVRLRGKRVFSGVKAAGPWDSWWRLTLVILLGLGLLIFLPMLLIMLIVFR